MVQPGIRCLAPGVRQGGRPDAGSFPVVHADVSRPHGTEVLLFARMPSGFLPQEDQARLFGQISLPPGPTAEQTEAVNKKVLDYLLTQEKDTVDGVVTVVGFNFAGSAQSSDMVVVKLKDWDKRPLPSQSADTVARRINQTFAGNRDARIIFFPLRRFPSWAMPRVSTLSWKTGDSSGATTSSPPAISSSAWRPRTRA